MGWFLPLLGSVGASLLGRRSSERQQEKAQERAYQQTREAAFDQQRMNNPNITNPYGSVSTTFGEDGQADINQQYNPLIQALFNQQVHSLSQGPSYYQGGRDPYNMSMMQNFNNRMGQRAGFETPQWADYQQQSQLPPQFQPPPEGFNQSEPVNSGPTQEGPRRTPFGPMMPRGQGGPGINEVPYRLKAAFEAERAGGVPTIGMPAGRRESESKYKDIIQAMMGGGY